MAEPDLSRAKSKSSKIKSVGDQVQNFEDIRKSLLRIVKEMLSEGDKVSVEYTLGKEAAVFEIVISVNDLLRFLSFKGSSLSELRTVALAMSGCKDSKALVCIRIDGRCP